MYPLETFFAACYIGSMDKLKEWRKALGLTQEETADVFGVKRLTILRYDKSIPPHMRRIMDLACRTLEADIEGARLCKQALEHE